MFRLFLLGVIDVPRQSACFPNHRGGSNGCCQRAFQLLPQLKLQLMRAGSLGRRSEVQREPLRGAGRSECCGVTTLTSLAYLTITATRLAWKPRGRVLNPKS